MQLNKGALGPLFIFKKTYNKVLTSYKKTGKIKIVKTYIFKGEIKMTKLNELLEMAKESTDIYNKPWTEKTLSQAILEGAFERFVYSDKKDLTKELLERFVSETEKAVIEGYGTWLNYSETLERYNTGTRYIDLK